MNYRPSSVSNRQTKNQGLRNAPPDTCHHNIDCLLKDAIRDEIDGAYSYGNILKEIQNSSMSGAKKERMIEIITHIRDDERQHKALLERLRM